MVAQAPRAAAARGEIGFRPFGAVALGMVVAVIGWLLIYVGGAWYSYELSALYDGRNVVTPLAPRALVLAIAAATSFVLLQSRLAAISAAILAMAGIAFSMFGGRLGGLMVLEPDNVLGMGCGAIHRSRRRCAISDTPSATARGMFRSCWFPASGSPSPSCSRVAGGYGDQPGWSPGQLLRQP